MSSIQKDEAVRLVIDWLAQFSCEPSDIMYTENKGYYIEVYQRGEKPIKLLLPDKISKLYEQVK